MHCWPAGSRKLRLLRVPLLCRAVLCRADKSDAWRLFHSLAPRLDGRAWPERERDRVVAFYDLVSELQVGGWGGGWGC